jgi:hypothetical protein
MCCFHVSSGLCIGILVVCLVFSYLVWRARCLHEWLCGTGAIGVYACSDVYSAAVCWRDVELCVLMFCIVNIYGVEYRIL